MMMRLLILVSILSMWALCAGAEEVTVSESPCAKRQVSISVVGEATGTPEMARLALVSEATAGNAEDALSQCQAKADEAVQAINTLAVAGITVNRHMYEFSTPSTEQAFGMMQATPSPAGTRAIQRITVEIPIANPINQGELAQGMAKVFQAANKVGVGFTRPTLKQSFMNETEVHAVEYVLRDASELRRKALEDALKKAEDLKTKLSGMNVRVGAMAHLLCSEGGRACGEVYMPGVDGKNTSGDSAEATSDNPEKVVVRSSVSVSYDLTND